jgi:hypothetical protein
MFMEITCGKNTSDILYVVALRQVIGKLWLVVRKVIKPWTRR